MRADTVGFIATSRKLSPTATVLSQAISYDGQRELGADAGDQEVNMSMADQIDSLRRDVTGLQTQVSRVEERLSAHSELSNERNENLQKRVETAEAAIIRQVSQLEATTAAAQTEATKRMQIVAGVVMAIVTAIAAYFGVAGVPVHEPASPTPQTQQAP